METSVTNFGTIIGALLIGFFTKYGKLKMIKFNNILMIIGIAICMVDNPTVIAMGRFVWGVAAGALCVLCPLFIDETSPIEFKGPLGALS
jgi:MFS family permease